jgi:uncharacterized membrane protein
MPKPAVLSQRIYSIDALRGIIMIIMALDHLRDFFHYTAATDDPTNLLTTTPLLFFTRWITHFCAPLFVFLAGISAFLMGQKKTKKELSIFLLKRGCWLVIVEILIVSLAWTYDPLYHVIILQVIWAIGISMIVLALFVWIPANAILICGLIIICFHNMLDYTENSSQAQVSLISDLLHHGRFTLIHLMPGHSALIVYAFLPWTGIMMTGYGMGRLFTHSFVPARRRRILYMSGFFALLLFFILRSVNQYGDPSHWFLQRSRFFTWLSIINLTKYPPSLDYILVMIGSGLIVLGFLDRINNRSLSFVRVFGRVPFFYYVVHLFLIHAMTVIFFYLQGYTAKDIAPQHLPFRFRPDHFGFGLGGVYLLWIALIMILYPLCQWYDQYKSTHRKWWLSYI